MVYSISGNNLRIVVLINYAFRFIYILFIVTHTQYDKIVDQTIKFTEEETKEAMTIVIRLIRTDADYLAA